MRLSKKAPHLFPGDIVDIIAPASGLPKEVLMKVPAFLESWGLRARFPKSILQPTALFSNSDEKRMAHLREALENSESKALWCLRGGYGSIRLLPALNQIPRPQKQKIFIGISDVTSLHVFFKQKWGWSTLHGSLIDRLAQGTLPQPCAKELRKVLFGEVDEVSFKLRPMNSLAKNLKIERAKIVGGNLVTLQSTLGTPFEIDTDEHFLFIEEIGERGYRVDRIFEHFAQAQKFKKCKGLFIGHFVGGAEPDGKVIWKQVLKEWADKLKIPVYGGLSSGHGQNLRTLPLGTEAVLKKGLLTVKTGIV